MFSQLKKTQNDVDQSNEQNDQYKLQSQPVNKIKIKIKKKKKSKGYVCSQLNQVCSFEHKIEEEEKKIM